MIILEMREGEFPGQTSGVALPCSANSAHGGFTRDEVVCDRDMGRDVLIWIVKNF
jgi:hypothetical protein